MEKRGVNFLPGRATPERKARVSDTLHLPSDSSIGRLRPELLGEGRFRIAFALHRDGFIDLPDKKIEKDRSRGVIAKIDKGATEIALRDIFSSRASDISPKMYEAFSRRLASERIVRNTFERIFRGMSLSEKIFLQKVPLSRATIQEFFPYLSLPDDFPPSVDISTLVYLQKKAPDIAFGTSSHELLFRCFEQVKPLSDSHFFHANNVFIDLQGSRNDISQSAGISPEVINIIRVAHGDLGLHRLLLDVLQRSFAYTSQMGAILDFMGSDNARVYKDISGTWRILFLDTYAPKPVFFHAREALRASELGYDITQSEVFALIQSLNYMRNMNALALALHSPVRFRFTSSSVAPLLQNLLPTIKKILSSVGA